MDRRKEEGFTGAFVANAKVLYDKLGFAFSMLAEILTRSKLGDEKRLGEILDETKSRARMRMENGSHAAAVGRASAYVSPWSAFNDVTGGVGYYQFLENVTARYGKEPDYRRELIKKLEETAFRLFAADNLLVGYTADEEGYAFLPKELQAFRTELFEGEKGRFAFTFTPDNKNEGFTTASQVNYVARCGHFAPVSYTHPDAADE